MTLIRPARAEEAGLLTALCLRSKAMHGYDAAFLDACRTELTVTPGMKNRRLYVAEHDGAVAGVVEISVEGGAAELEKLFVEPKHCGSGLGARLLDEARQAARRAGAATLFIDSDPGAAGFYERMGADRIGSAPSASVAGRTLPRYRIVLSAPRA